MILCTVGKNLTNGLYEGHINTYKYLKNNDSNALIYDWKNVYIH